MERPCSSERMDLDLTAIALLPNIPQIALSTDILSIDEEVQKARTALEKKYLKYLLATEKVFQTTACCTALVPYIENKLPIPVKDTVEQEDKIQCEMMEIDYEPPMKTPQVVSLKRKRLEDWVRWTPKMMKLQCC